MSTDSIFGPTIFSYSRQQAIDDGALVDVSAVASEAGFRIPVAMTSAVWQDCVEWTDLDSQRQTHQDQSGRMWDVVWMSFLAARRARCERLEFQLYRVPRGGRSTQPRLASLHMHIGPGDDGLPVITIMMPNED